MVTNSNLIFCNEFSVKLDTECGSCENHKHERFSQLWSNMYRTRPTWHACKQDLALAVLHKHPLSMSNKSATNQFYPQHHTWNTSYIHFREFFPFLILAIEILFAFGVMLHHGDAFISNYVKNKISPIM